ncbi:hypothetical protein P2Q72_22540 [Escherichia coli]|nr:hypothetical protein [Escherichia coli]MDF8767332.1 hypothetical protein [Escherichia coli]WHG05170.1 hypothetical protein QDX11_09540 [Escherichia coli]WHG10053.1 hypothetical protein QDX06_09525 [Escherichia coli]WHG39317.1 hypothetical protein QDY27_09310 [Escherichia coli]
MQQSIQERCCPATTISTSSRVWRRGGILAEFRSEPFFLTGAFYVRAECSNAAWNVGPYTIAVTNGAIVIHTQRLKSDPGGNLLS